MNRSTPGRVFWRLMWKEYRLQRAFWISVAVLAVLLMLLSIVAVNQNVVRVQWQFGVALVLPAIFALGCGATLFATDHETGTYEFQRSLPLRPALLLLGKGLFALLSIIGMYAATWLAAVILGSLTGNAKEVQVSPLAWALTGRLPGTLATYIFLPGAISGLFGLELFVWAAFFSLLLKRPLSAAIAGVATAAVALEFIVWFVHPQAPATRYLAVIPLRAVVSAVVALVDIYLGLRWLGEPSARQIGQRSPHGLSLQGFSAPRSNQFRTSTSFQVMAHLIWQQWRQSRWLLPAVGALIVPLALICPQIAMRSRTEGGFEQMWQMWQSGDELILFLQVAILLALSAFPLIGTATFFGDQQRRSFQFLTDRGVRPGQIWLSRQLPAWLAAALLATLYFVAVALVMLPTMAPHLVQGDDAAFAGTLVKYEVASIVALAVLGLSAGQFCSMLFRNGFLAAFFSLLLTCVLALWCGLMWIWGVSWLWSVLPIPLALLLATWLRTPHWLVDRNTLRAWISVGLALAVPAISILTGVPLYRAYEIPVVDPGFSPEQDAHPLTPAEQATRDLCERASKQFVRLEEFSEDSKKVLMTFHGTWPRPLTPEEIAWVDANQKAIATTMEVSRSKEWDSLDPPDSWKLGHLLVVSAARLVEQGELDAALAQYMASIRIAMQLHHALGAQHWYRPGPWIARDFDSYSDGIERETYRQLPYWAAHPKQTADRIIAAARQFDALTANLPAEDDAVKGEYVRLHSALSGDFASMMSAYDNRSKEEIYSLTGLWWRLPWERARALRLLNVLTRRQLDAIADAERTARSGGAIPQSRCDFRSIGFAIPYALRDGICLPPIDGPRQGDQDVLIYRYKTAVAVRRAVHLTLLLEAWKLRQGSLPKTLDEMVGPDLDHVPIDPFTGVPFRYLRDGLGIPLGWRQFAYNEFASGVIAAKVPFIWSAGERIVYKGYGKQDEDFLYDYRINDHFWSDTRDLRRADSEYDVWEAGWPFPVP